MSVSEWECEHLNKTKQGRQSKPRAGFIEGQWALDVGAGNQILILGSNSIDSKPLRHLSSPIYLSIINNADGRNNKDWAQPWFCDELETDKPQPWSTQPSKACCGADVSSSNIHITVSISKLDSKKVKGNRGFASAKQCSLRENWAVLRPHDVKKTVSKWFIK